MFRTLFYILNIFIFSALIFGCKDQSPKEKGIRISSDLDPDSAFTDSVPFMTRPGRVLLTGIPEYRLIPVYKVNRNKKGNYFTGSNEFHSWYRHHDPNSGNQWNDHIIPGLDAVYGYHMVNISQHNTTQNTRSLCFETPVLIKTIYYPAFNKDTLKHMPVMRNYYLISVYDQDTNNDGFINENDLRHFYYFDLRFDDKTPLVPANYSVIRSQYDPDNDYMYLYASPDTDGNGVIDTGDESHIFWIDLKNPKNNGRSY